MKKIIIFSKKEKIKEQVIREFANIDVLNCQSLGSFSEMINAEPENFFTIIIDLTEKLGWNALEFAKTRLNVQNLEVPIYAIVSSVTGYQKSDSPFTDDSPNTSENNLAVEYGVTSVVLESPENENLMILISDILTEDLELIRKNIYTEIQRLNSQMIITNPKSNAQPNINHYKNVLETLKGINL